MKNLLCTLVFILFSNLCFGQSNLTSNELSLDWQTVDYTDDMSIDPACVYVGFQNSEFTLNFDGTITASINGFDCSFTGHVFKFITQKNTWIGTSANGDYVKLSPGHAEIEIDELSMRFDK